MTPTKPNTRTKAVFVNLAKTNMEALYPRENFLRTPHGIKPVYLGHSKATCVDCERPLGRHPESEKYPGLVVLCGDNLMRLVDRQA